MAWPVLWVFTEKSQINNSNNIIEILKQLLKQILVN